MFGCGFRCRDLRHRRLRGTAAPASMLPLAQPARTLSSGLRPDSRALSHAPRDEITLSLPWPVTPTHQTKPNPEKNPRRDPTAAGERTPPSIGSLHITTSCWKNLRLGVVLTGTEVKSVRAGQANLKDSYGLVKDGELWLLNATSALTITATSSTTPRCAPASCWSIKRKFASCRQDPAEGPDPDPHPHVLQKWPGESGTCAGQGQAALGQARNRTPPHRRQGSPRGGRAGKKTVDQSSVRQSSVFTRPFHSREFIDPADGAAGVPTRRTVETPVPPLAHDSLPTGD